MGPVGVLCIRRTLAEGRLSGLASGLGAATVDAFYGSLAALGTTAVAGFLSGRRTWLRTGGGVFLLFLGGRAIFSKAAAPVRDVGGRGLLRSYGSTLLLTLTNPMTILSFTALFASLGMVPRGYGAAALVVAGVGAGSALWWFLLSLVVSRFRGRVGLPALRWVNLVSGAIIIGFALFAFWMLI